MVRTQLFHCGSLGSFPGPGTEILQMEQHSKKKKKKGHNPRCISRVAQMVKNPPAMQETRVQFLDQEDALKEGMATHCSILAWRIPWTEEPGYSPWGHKD